MMDLLCSESIHCSAAAKRNGFSRMWKTPMKVKAVVERVRNARGKEKVTGRDSSDPPVFQVTACLFSSAFSCITWMQRVCLIFSEVSVPTESSGCQRYTCHAMSRSITVAPHRSCHSLLAMLAMLAASPSAEMEGMS